MHQQGVVSSEQVPSHHPALLRVRSEIADTMVDQRPTVGRRDRHFAFVPLTKKIPWRKFDGVDPANIAIDVDVKALAAFHGDVAYGNAELPGGCYKNCFSFARADVHPTRTCDSGACDRYQRTHDRVIYWLRSAAGQQTSYADADLLKATKVGQLAAQYMTHSQEKLRKRTEVLAKMYERAQAELEECLEVQAKRVRCDRCGWVAAAAAATLLGRRVGVWVEVSTTACAGTPTALLTRRTIRRS